MFVGLTIMFGSIIIVDGIKENSPSNKRKTAQAQQEAQIIFEQAMNKVQKEVNEREEIRKKYNVSRET